MFGHHAIFHFPRYFLSFNVEVLIPNAMKHRPLVLKIAVVAFSATLAIWLVAYRSGAFDSTKAASAQALAKPQENAHGIVPLDTPPPTKPIHVEDIYLDEEELMGSSKSGVIFKPLPTQATTTDTPEQRQRTLMGGSKNDEIFVPDANPGPTEVDSPTLHWTKERTSFMGSSKSGPVLEGSRPVQVQWRKTDSVPSQAQPTQQAPNQPPK